MAKKLKTKRIPQLTLHKASGKARVRIDGKDHYCGPWGSAKAEARYDELIEEHFGEGQFPVAAVKLSGLLAAWWTECKRRYAGRGKGRYGNAVCWRPVIRLLRVNFGDERPQDLGPVRVRAAIEAEAKERDWSARYAKMVLTRVKYIFAWGVAEEMVPLSTSQRIDTITLRIGKKKPKIQPVDVKVLGRTLRHLSPKVSAMVRLQRLTGMRPGELVTMKADEVDRRAEVWVYIPATHKNEHRDQDRRIYLGPRAQAVLSPWLIKAGDGFVFPSTAGRSYTSDSYRRAIHRVCESHGIPKWSPHQLRKSAATRIRSALDVEHAASALGHSSSVVTGDHYAAADQKRAIEAARKLG